MSLKTLHIVFMIASTLMTLFFGGWAWREYFGPNGSAIHLVYGLLSIGLLVGLYFYGRYFLRKLKHISYL